MPAASECGGGFPGSGTMWLHFQQRGSGTEAGFGMMDGAERIVWERLEVPARSRQFLPATMKLLLCSCTSLKQRQYRMNVRSELGGLSTESCTAHLVRSE